MPGAPRNLPVLMAGVTTAAADPSGVILNVQGYSIHDGPGIRTTVFLKGCPLRCLWCHNPESQRMLPELEFAAEKCLGCGRCVAACTHGAIRLEGGRSHTDRTCCLGSGDCVAACPNGARGLHGRRITAQQLFYEVRADLPFFRQSGGGVTLSGGEPLAQPELAQRVLELCREAGIHTVIDTCGYARWETARPVLELADLVLFDLKHMDPEEHRRLTGVDNRQILANARRIHHELGRPMHARIPVIPGHNDSDENIEATARFVAEELSPSVPVCLQPYHRYGAAKNERLERTYELAHVEPPGESRMEELCQAFEGWGLTAVVGEYPYERAKRIERLEMNA